jgi:protein gp37
VGANTKIEWCDMTWNPWIGCSKVSPGCLHCYAEARDQRFDKGVHWGKGAPRRRTSAANWAQPLKWNKENRHCVECRNWFAGPRQDCPQCRKVNWHEARPRVFCASLTDWLDDEVPIEWLADLLKLIHDTPNLDWLLLTKRPQNWKSHMTHVMACSSRTGRNDEDLFGFAYDWLYGNHPSNVWIGTSVEDQTRADERIPLLLDIPAKVRFLSCEPQLGPVDLFRACFGPDITFGMNHGPALRFGVDWVIVGGESGHGAREFDLDWARSLVEQCRAAGVACFVKQLGENPIEQVSGMRPTSLGLIHDKKGGDMAEWPADLRVREFPKVEVLA